MPTFRDALRSAIVDALCQAIDDPATALALLRFVRGSPQLILTTAVALFVARQLCNSRDPEPEPPVPFTGGQCDCVRYDVFYEYLWDTSRTDDGICRQSWQPANHRLWGPIKGWRFRQEEQTFCGAAYRSLEIDCKGEAGGFEECGTQRWVPVLSFRFNAIRNFRVVRVDGLPDNCGSLPPIIPPVPPGGITRTVNVTYDSDGISVTVPVFLAFFNAFLDANLELQFPITLSLNGTINFNATINIGTGDVIFQFFPYNAPPPGQPPAFPPGLPPGRGGPNPNSTPVPPPAPPPGPEFENEPPEETPTPRQVIRAVAVTVLSDIGGDRSIILQEGGNPDIIVPDLGMVQFRVQVGQSTFWTNNQRVNNIRALIPCEWEGGAIEVSGTPRPGITWELTPIYASASLVNGNANR